MSQDEVLEVLKEHKDEWLCHADIKQAYPSSSVSNYLGKLRRKGVVYAKRMKVPFQTSKYFYKYKEVEYEQY